MHACSTPVSRGSPASPSRHTCVPAVPQEAQSAHPYPRNSPTSHSWHTRLPVAPQQPNKHTRLFLQQPTWPQPQTCVPVAPQQVLQRSAAGGHRGGGGGLPVLEIKHDDLRHQVPGFILTVNSRLRQQQSSWPAAASAAPSRDAGQSMRDVGGDAARACPGAAPHQTAHSVATPPHASCLRNSPVHSIPLAAPRPLTNPCTTTIAHLPTHLALAHKAQSSLPARTQRIRATPPTSRCSSRNSSSWVPEKAQRSVPPAPMST